MEDRITVHGFISRNDDWVLPHHLRVYSAFCDRIVVLLDRSPQSEVICRRFPNVEVHHWTPTLEMRDFNANGIVCEEGDMRQRVWDLCAAHRPRWIALGDTDEAPTPDILHWDREREGVDCWYADWVNLWRDSEHALGGQQSEWSFQVATNNKKGLLVRWRADRQYRYRRHHQHVRMEPNPLHEGQTVFDSAHQLGQPKLMHYKYANRRRWEAHPLSREDRFVRMDADAEVVRVPRNWLWQWDGDELLKGLADPIAVVGNGQMGRHGAAIDAHATVIRFNNFRTEGFEDCCGRRTDVWCVNCGGDIERRPWTGEMLATSTATENPGVALWLGVYPHLHVPADSWTTPLRKLQACNPTTGLTLLHRLVELGRRVNAFGFDGQQNRTGHYWNSGETATVHQDEAGAIATLAAMGIQFV